MNERITINPTIRFGKPCIAGTRISVQDVLEIIREGISFEQIIREYFPTLSQQDIERAFSMRSIWSRMKTSMSRPRHEIPFG